eukprot:TRINITY_DN48748_c0_g1_i1.p1 TRINITY_DN48748_c0_g1~~TRINITY_DN48748_c0_g1_i1.p1  ORF type:complete len:433 (-),score=57.14 TRINITY_DN48748_c0_g1_i1:421-1581(-)
MAAVAMNFGDASVAFAPFLKRSDRQESWMPSQAGKKVNMTSPLSVCLDPLPARPMTKVKEGTMVPVTYHWPRPKRQARSALPPLERCASREGCMASFPSNSKSAMEEDLGTPSSSLSRSGGLLRAATTQNLGSSASAPSLLGCGLERATTTQAESSPSAMLNSGSLRFGSSSGRSLCFGSVSRDKSRRSKRRQSSGSASCSRLKAADPFSVTRPAPALTSTKPLGNAPVLPSPEMHLQANERLGAGEAGTQDAPETKLVAAVCQDSSGPPTVVEMGFRRVRPGEVLNFVDAETDEEDLESDLEDALREEADALDDVDPAVVAARQRALSSPSTEAVRSASRSEDVSHGSCRERSQSPSKESVWTDNPEAWEDSEYEDVGYISDEEV